MIPDYGAGINGGLQGKLASVIDLVILNMALDHSHINLPLTNRANDAHPKRCLERREIHPFLSFFLLLLPCVGLLVSSPAPTHLTFYSLSTPTFTHNFLSASFTLQPPLTPAIPYSHLFAQVLHSARTPRQKTPLVQRWESGLVNGHNEEDDWRDADRVDWRRGLKTGR